MHNVNDPYLTDKEGARLMGVSVPTWWRRVKDKTLPPPIKFGGCSRWRLSEIEAVRSKLEAARAQRAS
ncbi:MAG: helix-turn-helix domain-containing protein [Pseudomonadota bacterium]